MTFTWQGRRLATASANGKSLSFKYNSNGIRTQKTVNGVTTYFTLDGSKIISQKTGNQEIFFEYDAQGNVATMIYNGQTYYYVRNLMGEILGLTDSSGNMIVEYLYDPWGKLIDYSNTGNFDLANLNPFKYKDYYYDSELGFYYLNSRYYDPITSRFINADGQISGTGGEILGYNVFAYCFNNPITMNDSTGNWPKWATIALGVAVAAIAVAATVVTLGTAAPAAACALTSAAMSIGASYTVASTAAAVAVAGTIAMAATYAGDIAYSTVTGESPLLNTVFKGNTDAYNTGLAITTFATGGMLEMATQSPGVCFVAGTPVLAKSGYIAIEDIKTGDMVWAENPETGEKELKEVVQTFVNETSELIYVEVHGEEIVTTPEHPFYSPVKGWTSACELRAGDILVLHSGKYVTVEKVQHEIFEAPITVYNFEVADFHTYYVGKSAVLVHNTCGGKRTSPNQMQKQVERGQAPSTVVRVDNPKIQGQLPHIHFNDGTAMNIDGSVHDAKNGVHNLTNGERIWIFENGWGG